MKKPLIKPAIPIVSISFLLVLTFVAYLSVSFYFKNKIGPNTWVNGQYVTGLSSKEVNESLYNDLNVPFFTFYSPNGKEYVIDLSEIDYTYSFEENDFGTSTDPVFNWPLSLNKTKDYDISATFSYNKEKLKDIIINCDFIQDELNSSAGYSYFYSKQSARYEESNTLNGHLDTDKVCEIIINAINSGIYEIRLSDYELYFDYEPNEEQLASMAAFDKINQYQNCDLIYDMGDEKITFTPEMMIGFLLKTNNIPVTDENGNFVLNEIKVDEFVDNLCSDYDTWETTGEFETTSGDIVEVPYITYGTKLNAEAEKAFLMDNLLKASLHDGTADTRIPEYEISGYSRGLNDIGDTYIEVDLTDQKIYYYEDGEIVLQSDVVSGNHALSRDTVTGVYYIFNKETDRYLVGANYTSFVHYWMPFYKGYGLHDSTWRDEYGGDIYLNSGSHGCVNLPLEFASQIYEKIEIGMPIVVFYKEES